MNPKSTENTEAVEMSEAEEHELTGTDGNIVAFFTDSNGNKRPSLLCKLKESAEDCATRLEEMGWNVSEVEHTAREQATDQLRLDATGEGA